MNHILRTAIVTIALGTLLSDAPAQMAEQDTPPPREPLLGGPTVPDEVMRSLIEVDGMGRFVRLQIRPEEAALGRALVDPDRRERAREATETRKQALGMLLVDNIDRVRDATDAIAAGENDTVTAIYREMFDRFEAEHRRAPLLPVYAEVLAPEELAEVTRLVDEYWEAWLAWELRNVSDRPAAMDNSDEAQAAMEQRLSFQLFREELAQAYSWTLRPFRYKLEALYEATEATPEQRKALRAVIIDYVRTTRLKPTPEQRRETADAIYSILDETQRRKLFTHMLWRM
jgi:hypothetical protein